MSSVPVHGNESIWPHDNEPQYGLLSRKSVANTCRVVAGCAPRTQPAIADPGGQHQRGTTNQGGLTRGRMMVEVHLVTPIRARASYSAYLGKIIDDQT